MLKMKGFAMNEGEKNASWLDTPDPQRFIKNAAKFNDLMMMYRCAIREMCIRDSNMTAVKTYRWLYIICVFFGPYMTVAAVWNIADIFNA